MKYQLRPTTTIKVMQKRTRQKKKKLYTMHSLRSSRQDTQVSLCFIKRARLVKLLPSSPFRLSPCFFIGVHRFLSASCFYFHLLKFLGYDMLAVSISFFNLDFIGWHVFDIWSGHIYFQGQYSLCFFPFVCSIFLVIFFALVDFVFNALLVIILL